MLIPIIRLEPVMTLPKGTEAKYSKEQDYFYCGRCGTTLTNLSSENMDGKSRSKNPALEQQLSDYKKELKLLRSQLDETESKFLGIQKELDEKCAEVVDLRSNLNASDKLIAVLKVEMDNQKGLFKSKSKETVEGLKELRSRMVSLENDLEKSRESNHNLSQTIDALKEEVAVKDALVLEREAKLEVLARNYNCLERDMKSLKMECKDLRDDKSRLMMEMDDVNNTNRHLRKQTSDLKSVDTRAIVKMFLGYQSDILNACQDKETLEELREFIFMRDKLLKVNSPGLGLEIIQHGRGVGLSDEKVTLEPVHTDKEELDGKVKSSDCSGCRFKAEFLTEIPEEITVFSYKSIDSEPVQTEETRTEDFETEPQTNSAEESAITEG